MARNKRTAKKKRNETGNGANLAFESKLSAPADKLPGHTDAYESTAVPGTPSPCGLQPSFNRSLEAEPRLATMASGRHKGLTDSGKRYHSLRQLPAIQGRENSTPGSDDSMPAGVPAPRSRRRLHSHSTIREFWGLEWQLPASQRPLLVTQYAYASAWWPIGQSR